MRGFVTSLLKNQRDKESSLYHYDEKDSVREVPPLVTYFYKFQKKSFFPNDVFETLQNVANKVGATAENESFVIDYLYNTFKPPSREDSKTIKSNYPSCLKQLRPNHVEELRSCTTVLSKFDPLSSQFDMYSAYPTVRNSHIQFRSRALIPSSYASEDPLASLEEFWDLSCSEFQSLAGETKATSPSLEQWKIQKTDSPTDTTIGKILLLLCNSDIKLAATPEVKENFTKALNYIVIDDQEQLATILLFDMDLLSKIYHEKHALLHRMNEVFLEVQKYDTQEGEKKAAEMLQTGNLIGVKMKSAKKKQYTSNSLSNTTDWDTLLKFGEGYINLLLSGSVRAATSLFGDKKKQGLGRAGEVSIPNLQKEENEEMKFTKYIIPANKRRVPDKDTLIPINALPAWCQKVFDNISYLNELQSLVFDAAFYNNGNLLVSAPTGAGKTNVALLTVLQCLNAYVREHGEIPLAKNFKMVYIAPMKALVTEVQEKFEDRLRCLGLRVAEMTGDVQPSKKELNDIHLIVTTPEKWDSISRAALSSGMISEDNSSNMLKACQLIILDEIHLLNEERGPVLEAIVARTIQQEELLQKKTRIVGLSATLPNVTDIARFIKAEFIFNFSSEFRPIPLRQTLIGVSPERDQRAKAEKLNLVAFYECLEYLKNGKQVMVFVHSRKDTFNTALAFLDLAKAEQLEELFKPYYPQEPKDNRRLIDSAKNQHVKLLYESGLGMHNAGMIRPDRKMCEKLFLEGAIRILFCTATLAWGVNLPAHAVIIKGTQVYNADRGGITDLGILDVLQIFGRAGRPQFDTEGNACLITMNEGSESKLQKYLRLLSHQLPIESQMDSRLEDFVNAEIACGNIGSMEEAMKWIKQTYYGARIRGSDTQNVWDRVVRAIENLSEYRMINVMSSEGLITSVSITDVGRVASRNYVSVTTIDTWRKLLKPSMTLLEILKLFASAVEFKNLVLREDETNELIKINKEYCRVKSPTVNSEIDKAIILIQVYIGRTKLESSSLISDLNTVSDSIDRLVRAFYDISLSQFAGEDFSETSLVSVCEDILELSKMIEWKSWGYIYGMVGYEPNILRHFMYDPPSNAKRNDHYSHDPSKVNPNLIKFNTVQRLEELGYNYDSLLDMTSDELGAILSLPKREGDRLKTFLRIVPFLEVNVKTRPIITTVLKIDVDITPNFFWSNAWHNINGENFTMWVVDDMKDLLLHKEEFIVTSNHVAKSVSIHISCTVPVNNSTRQLSVRVMSTRWMNVSFYQSFIVGHLLLPNQSIYTDLLPLKPLHISALANVDYESLYKIQYLNPIQTQAFHTVYYTNQNVLMGAPTGSGKTLIAEMAIFNLLNNHPEQKVVYIAPLKSLVKERVSDWKKKFQDRLKLRVCELTGDVTPDMRLLEASNIIITTPEKWDGVTRQWQRREYVQQVGLLIIDEVHLLGNDRGPVLEAIVSRVRYISKTTNSNVRIIALSTALSNARDVANWLGVKETGFFNFRPSVRPIPLSVFIKGVTEKHYCPRNALMNPIIYKFILQHSSEKPVLIFTSSRRQTRITANDIINLAMRFESEGYIPDKIDGQDMWKHPRTCRFVRKDLKDDHCRPILASIQDSQLRETMNFGIAMHHAGMSEHDRDVSIQLYLEGYIQVLVCTSTLAWGVNLPAHLVVIKGTEIFDASQGRYVDMPLTDIIQMLGRAGRPGFDDSAVGLICLQSSKKDFYHKFLYESFPVESALLDVLDDHLNAEICNKSITDEESALAWLSHTYLYRRMINNANYYYPSSISEEGEIESISENKKQMAKNISNSILASITRLQESYCVQISRDRLNNNLCFKSTLIGNVCSYYYLKHETIRFLTDTIRASSNMKFMDILGTISQCKEFDQLPVRHNEEILNEEYIRNVCPFHPLPNAPYTSAYLKTALLLCAHIFSLELPIVDYVIDQKMVLDQIMRILNACIDISLIENQLSNTLEFVQFVQCLIQGTHPLRNPLFQLPSINNDKTAEKIHYNLKEHFAKKSNATLPINAGLSYLVNNASSLSSAIRGFAGVEKDIRLIPSIKHLSIDLYDAVHVHGNIYKTMDKLEQPYVCEKDSFVQIRVTIHLNEGFSPFALDNQLPKKKNINFVLVIGDKEIDEIICMKKVTLNTGTLQYRAQFNIQVPSDSNEGHQLTLIVMNDSYVSLDTEYPIYLTVMDKLKPHQNRLVHEDEESIVIEKAPRNGKEKNLNLKMNFNTNLIESSLQTQENKKQFEKIRPAPTPNTGAQNFNQNLFTGVSQSPFTNDIKANERKALPKSNAHPNTAKPVRGQNKSDASQPRTDSRGERGRGKSNPGFKQTNTSTNQYKKAAKQEEEEGGFW